MNSVVHFEMPYDDRKRVAKFYESAFGWQMQMFGEDMGNYVLATTVETDEKGPKRPGAINGGFYSKKPAWPAQYPSIVIAVDDIQKGGRKRRQARRARARRPGTALLPGRRAGSGPAVMRRRSGEAGAARAARRPPLRPEARSPSFPRRVRRNRIACGAAAKTWNFSITTSRKWPEIASRMLTLQELSTPA